jgi:hypothetical protein
MAHLGVSFGKAEAHMSAWPDSMLMFGELSPVEPSLLLSRCSVRKRRAGAT